MDAIAPPRPLDPTPPRPDRPLAAPVGALHMAVEVEVAHLANPLVAVARLLASEAGAHARVVGDEAAFDVVVALPGPAAADDAEAWVRWAVHNAGVRGRLSRRAG